MTLRIRSVRFSLLAASAALAACTAAPGEPDWRALTLADFVVVNGDPDTWTGDGGAIACSGMPNGGARSRERFTDFELELEWRHDRHAGNSGVFLWCPEEAFTDLPPGQLPRSGIEVQVLDPGYEDDWRRQHGARSDWFTSHGDVFPVGASTMRPRTPRITYELAGGETCTVGRADGTRSFPSERRTLPAGQWNHYRIRAEQGEVRLWVNGAEVNGATGCSPSRGYLALEAEGARVTFRNLRLRAL
jgi:hypothetical protein